MFYQQKSFAARRRVLSNMVT